MFCTKFGNKSLQKSLVIRFEIFYKDLVSCLANVQKPRHLATTLLKTLESVVTFQSTLKLMLNAFSFSVSKFKKLLLNTASLI